MKPASRADAGPSNSLGSFSQPAGSISPLYGSWQEAQRVESHLPKLRKTWIRDSDPGGLQRLPCIRPDCPSTLDSTTSWLTTPVGSSRCWSHPPRNIFSPLSCTLPLLLPSVLSCSFPTPPTPRILISPRDVESGPRDEGGGWKL